jgi:hypothetical protein
MQTESSDRIDRKKGSCCRAADLKKQHRSSLHCRQGSLATYSRTAATYAGRATLHSLCGMVGCAVAVALWLPLISTSGGNGSGTAAAAAATRRQANSSSWQFAASGAAVTNPMRGFRHQIDGFCGDPHHSGDPGGEKAVAAGLKVCEQLNMTVSLSYCYLSPWWNISLPSAMLTNLDARLGDMRRAGVSALLNFGYEDGKTNFHDDVEPYGFPQIYAHVDQLTPVLLRNADVIYGLQAGFIGNAGEWAHDIRGLLTNVSGLATLVSKLLYQAVPDRQVLVRKGEEKLHMLQGTAFAHCAGQPPVCSGAAAAAQQQRFTNPRRWVRGVNVLGSL